MANDKKKPTCPSCKEENSLVKSLSGMLYCIICSWTGTGKQVKEITFKID